MPAPAAALAAGAEVRLCGLVARQDLNERRGVVAGPPNDAGRIPVRVSQAGALAAEQVLLKPANVMEATDAVESILENQLQREQPPSSENKGTTS